MHEWYYCEHCSCPIVLCGTCGNNTCNGSEGCDDCKEAYKMAASREGCPSEFSLREEVEHGIFSIKNVDVLKEMLCKENTVMEVNAILKQIKHLTD